MEKLLTVIVPIYNVEKYLDKCIKSIINQTYKKLEIILINDGSPDNCGVICDNYKKIDNRIKVIHQQNQGQAISRNLGIKLSKGDYISFVDADDYLELDMYKKMMDIIEKYDCEIVECGYSEIYSDRIISTENTRDISFLDKSYLIEQLLNIEKNHIPRVAVWNKIYKKTILQNICFPDGKIHEDYLFEFNCFKKINKYVYYSEPLYNHIYFNEKSTTKQKLNPKFIDFAYIWKSILNETYKMKNKRFIDLAQYSYSLSLVNCRMIAIRNDVLFPEEYILDLKKYRKYILKNGLSIKNIYYYLFSVFPSLMYNIHQLIRK